MDRVADLSQCNSRLVACSVISPLDLVSIFISLLQVSK